MLQRQERLHELMQGQHLKTEEELDSFDERARLDRCASHGGG